MRPLFHFAWERRPFSAWRPAAGLDIGRRTEIGRKPLCGFTGGSQSCVRIEDRIGGVSGGADGCPLLSRAGGRPDVNDLIAREDFGGETCTGFPVSQNI